MARTDKIAFDEAKAAWKQAHEEFETAVTETVAAVADGTLTEEGAALLIAEAKAQLRAAGEAWKAAVKAKHKPKRPKGE